jgi:hypothetical protein
MHLNELFNNTLGYYMQEPTQGRAQPPANGVMEVYWERAVEDSPSCSAGVKNRCCYLSAPPVTSFYIDTKF